jgi:hypothetical protein
MQTRLSVIMRRFRPQYESVRLLSAGTARFNHHDRLPALCGAYSAISDGPPSRKQRDKPGA